MLEAGDALVHVPAERADHADVVVEVHLPVGHEIETGLLLVPDHNLGGVLVCLLVVDVLERDAHVTPEQLVVEPVGARVGPHHRRGQDRVGDLLWHLLPLSRRDVRAMLMP